MKCAGCNKEVGRGDQFCKYCGFALRTYSETFEKARRNFNRGDYAAALELLRQAAAEQPNEAMLHAWLGHALFYLGRTAEAEDEYHRTLQLDPERWDALYQVASLEFSNGRFKESVAQYEILLKLKVQLRGNPLEALFGGDAKRMFSTAWLHLGLALKELGHLKKARTALEKSLQLDKTNPLAYGVLADLQMIQGDFAGAIKAYRQALLRVEDESSLVSFHNDLGVAYFRAEDMEKAAAEFKWVLKRDPKNSNAVYNLGVLFLKQGKQEDMRSDIRELMRSDEAEHIFTGLASSMADAAKREATEEKSQKILGNSQAMRQVMGLVRRAAATDATVLILGENGTGKEMVARAIHENSHRSQKPLVAVNCAALPESLLESELFGYEKGAFTGASNAKPGRFELAEGGTLFLDEIGDLDATLQVKLLRVLQDRTYERLGGTSTILADVRVIAATHRDLAAKVREGSFRDDLYYRLYVIPVQIPPLRDRTEDIPVLARHFLDRYSRRNKKRFNRIDPDALGLLGNWHWPGNVRELENTIERAVALYEDEVLRREYLDFSGPELPSAAAELKALARERHPDEMGQEDDELGPVELAEKRLILERLRGAGYRVTRAARDMGLSRATFYRKMDKYQIRPRDIN